MEYKIITGKIRLTATHPRHDLVKRRVEVTVPDLGAALASCRHLYRVGYRKIHIDRLQRVQPDTTRTDYVPVP